MFGSDAGQSEAPRSSYESRVYDPGTVQRSQSWQTSLKVRRVPFGEALCRYFQMWRIKIVLYHPPAHSSCILKDEAQGPMLIMK